MAAAAIPGAQELFDQAGVVVMTNRRVPKGKEIENPMVFMEAAGAGDADDAAVVPMAGQAEPTRDAEESREHRRERAGRAAARAPVLPGNLALDRPDHRRRRTRDAVRHRAGQHHDLDVPRRRPLQEHGLGIGEAELRVFQPFFVTVDLPFSAIRGEELPVKVALYNYGSESRHLRSRPLTDGDWFDLLGEPTQTVDRRCQQVGAAEFLIRPTPSASSQLRVTARGSRERGRHRQGSARRAGRRRSARRSRTWC